MGWGFGRIACNPSLQPPTIQRINPSFLGKTPLVARLRFNFWLETKKQHWQQENQDCQQSCRCIPCNKLTLKSSSSICSNGNFIPARMLKASEICFGEWVCPGSEFRNLKLRLFYDVFSTVMATGQKMVYPPEWKTGMKYSPQNEVLCREISTKFHLWDEEIWTSLIFPCLHRRDSQGFCRQRCSIQSRLPL